MTAARQLTIEDICANRHRGNAESLAAYESVAPTKEQTRAAIVRLARELGDRGITADEVAEAWGVSHNHVAPRISELKAAGRLIVTTMRRLTRSGCSARVLVAS